MKTRTLIALAMVFLVSAFAMAGGGSETATSADGEQSFTFVYAEVNPLDSIVGQTGTRFAEEVERLTDGTVTIDIQHSGVLGDEAAVLDAMLGGSGTIDMSRISAFALTSYGGEKSSLLSIPYTFADREHFWNFADSELAPEFLLEPLENGSGIRGLFYGEEGFRHFFGTEPLNSIDDLEGLKVRVSNDPIARGMVEGLGADPTVVNYNELYSALQSGVVDAAEQPIANYYSRSFYEVAPYMILDGHTLGAIQVIITEDAWGRLSEGQQEAIMEAGRIASQFNRELSEGAENEVLEALAEAGATVVEVEDKSAWQEAVSEVVEMATADNAELYQRILDLQ